MTLDLTIRIALLQPPNRTGIHSVTRIFSLPETRIGRSHSLSISSGKLSYHCLPIFRDYE